jgi:hypothetical protein
MQYFADNANRVIADTTDVVPKRRRTIRLDAGR